MEARRAYFTGHPRKILGAWSPSTECNLDSLVLLPYLDLTTENDSLNVSVFLQINWNNNKPRDTFLKLKLIKFNLVTFFIDNFYHKGM